MAKLGSFLKGDQSSFPKRDPENCFSLSSFHSAVDFAKSHENVDGVDAILATVKKRLIEYDDQKKKLIEEYQPQLDAAYEKYLKDASTSRKIAIAVIVEILAAILLSTVGRSISIGLYLLNFAFSAIFAIDLLAIPITLIAMFIFKRAVVKVDEKKYESIFDNLREAANELTQKHRKKNDHACDLIDSLYLSSLSPQERQLVLMRREQQAQHDEMMRQQRKHQAEVERVQSQIQRDQRELLEYERERQRRMGRY